MDWQLGDVGTWAGAIATAGAVYVAARLSERTRKREALETKKNRYAAIRIIFLQADRLIRELADAASPGPKAIGAAPPSVDQFSDLLAALDSVPFLDLGSALAADRVFQVKRALIFGRDHVRQYGSPGWVDVEVRWHCGQSEATIANAAVEAGMAADKGVWPHKNRAGDWVFGPEY
jgi:hypothetical protein